MYLSLFIRKCFRVVGPAGLMLLAFAFHGAAQTMPSDSDAWRNQCTQSLDSGTLPAPGAGGLAPTRLEQLARERSSRNQHYVACTLYLAAASGQGGVGQAASNDLTMARIERKLGHGDKLSFSEKISKGASAAIGLATPAAPANAIEAGTLNAMVTPGGGQLGLAAGQLPLGASPGAQVGQAGPGQMAQGGPFGQPLAASNGMQQGAAFGQQAGQMPTGAYGAQMGQAGPMGQAAQMPQGTAMAQGSPIASPGGPGQAPTGMSPAVQASPASNAWGASASASVQPVSSGFQGAAQPAVAQSQAGPAPQAQIVPVSNSQYAHPPFGRYTCHSGRMTVLANGLGYNPMTIQVAGFTGYLHIVDRSHYGGNESGPPKDIGTYVMNGNDIVPQTGPYKRVPAVLHYVADGQYHRPTMYLQWLKDNGQPMGAGSMICTWDGAGSK